MSWAATAYVKDLQTTPDGQRLTRSEKLILFVLADYSDPDTGCAWPSFETLAEKALMSRSSAFATIRSLRDKGMIEVEQRRSGQRRASNRYRILGVAAQPALFSDRVGSVDNPGSTSNSCTYRNAEERSVQTGLEPPIEPIEQTEKLSTGKLSTASGVAAGRRLVSDLDLGDDTEVGAMPNELKSTP